MLHLPLMKAFHHLPMLQPVAQAPFQNFLDPSTSPHHLQTLTCTTQPNTLHYNWQNIRHPKIPQSSLLSKVTWSHLGWSRKPKLQTFKVVWAHWLQSHAKAHTVMYTFGFKSHTSRVFSFTNTFESSHSVETDDLRPWEVPMVNPNL